MVAVLGPNGAGKTTLLSVIAGLHPATGGSIVLAGRRVNGAEPDALARAGLCLVPEGRGIFPNLTVHEHLRMATHSGRRLSDIEAETYERFPRLAERRTQVAGTLSGGEQQMLALARGLATQPALLMLDELSMGLAPLIVEELYAQVAAIAASGVSIVVVEQFAAHRARRRRPRRHPRPGSHRRGRRPGGHRGRAVGRLPRRDRRRRLP